MRRSTWVGVVVMAVMVSGCAGGQQRQEMSRFQSQLGLLEERIGQLERSQNMGAANLIGGASSGSEPATVNLSETTPAAPAVVPEPAARKMTGKPTTRQIQQALKNAGFYQGALDGKMGPVTRASVKEFQRVHGLKDDGVVGKQTWEKLQTYADLSTTPGEVSASESLK